MIITYWTDPRRRRSKVHLGKDSGTLRELAFTLCGRGTSKLRRMHSPVFSLNYDICKRCQSIHKGGELNNA